MKSAERGTVVRLKPSTLRWWVFLGTGMTTLVGATMFLIFAQLQSTNGKWLWQDGFQLDGGQWFDAARTTVTLVGIIGLGGAAFLAYRRQVSTEATHLLEQSSGLRDRYTTCAEQLAHDSVAIRLAGVYALASLAEDWHEYGNDNERQVCIDLLCAYLRTPATTQEPTTTRSAGRSLAGHRHPRSSPSQPAEISPDREVRTTIQGVIRHHLVTAPPEASWSAHAFDFHGAVLSDFDFAGAIFIGPVSFGGTHFHGERTSFDRAHFHGRQTSFDGAHFYGERTSFDEAHFHSMQMSFDGAHFYGERTSFDGAHFFGEWKRIQGSTLWAHFWAYFFPMRVALKWSNTSFRGAHFHSERTSFEDPGLWKNVYFDWDESPPRTTKPDSVLPHAWPPTVLDT